MQTAKLIILLILLALVAVFTFQNTAPLALTFLFWSTELSASLLLLACMFAGILIGYALAVINRSIARRKRAAAQQEPTTTY